MSDMLHQLVGSELVILEQALRAKLSLTAHLEYRQRSTDQLKHIGHY